MVGAFYRTHLDISVESVVAEGGVHLANLIDVHKIVRFRMGHAQRHHWTPAAEEYVIFGESFLDVNQIRMCVTTLSESIVPPVWSMFSSASCTASSTVRVLQSDAETSLPCPGAIVSLLSSCFSGRTSGSAFSWQPLKIKSAAVMSRYDSV